MTDSHICNGCPGAMMGDCDGCSVHEREEEHDDHDIESYDPDFNPDEGESDPGGGETEGGEQ